MVLLRGIKKLRWILVPNTVKDDTDILNLPPDPIGDLPTQSMKLSVWNIGSDKRRLEETIKELASRRKPQHYEYATFSSDILDDLGIIYEKKIDIQAKNLGQYHYNINIPTSEKLLEFAKSLILNAETARLTKLEITKIP